MIYFTFTQTSLPLETTEYYSASIHVVRYLLLRRPLPIVVCVVALPFNFCDITKLTFPWLLSLNHSTFHYPDTVDQNLLGWKEVALLHGL